MSWTSTSFICLSTYVAYPFVSSAMSSGWSLFLTLFKTHPQLSRISKSIVGIPVLAEKLVKIQGEIIAKYFPDILSKIENIHSANLEEFEKMPNRMTSITEATMAFMDILGDAKDSLKKILLAQGEFDEYHDSKEMRGTARLAEILNMYSQELQSDNYSTENFLMDEIEVLEEVNSIGLPKFPPKSAFRILLQKKVKAISAKPAGFVEKIWSYVENVVITVLLRHCENYPQLETFMKKTVRNLILKKRKQSVDWVNVMVEMEKLTDYTCSPEYVASLNNLMSCQNDFTNNVTNYSSTFYPTYSLTFPVFGYVNVGHLGDHQDVVQEAFEVKMRITAYWEIVTRRMVDNMALHIQYSIHNLVMGKEMKTEIITGKGVERMMEESPSIAEKRNKLERFIKLLEARMYSQTSWARFRSTNLD